MGLGIGSIVKIGKTLTSGNLDPDAFAEMLAQLGMEASFDEVAPANRKGEFESRWLEGTARDAKVLRIRIRAKTGESYSGLLVSNPAHAENK